MCNFLLIYTCFAQYTNSIGVVFICRPSQTIEKQRIDWSVQTSRPSFRYVYILEFNIRIVSTWKWIWVWTEAVFRSKLTIQTFNGRCTVDYGDIHESRRAGKFHNPFTLANLIITTISGVNRSIKLAVGEFNIYVQTYYMVYIFSRKYEREHKNYVAHKIWLWLVFTILYGYST